MTPQHFIAKWQAAQLSERSACQQHFLDLCDLLGQPKPAEADPDGAWYTFEKGVRTSTDGNGFADVWMRGKFGWEYKGKRKDLKAAYQQLLRYREDLENPPLLVVCDLDRLEVHTNFTGTAKRVFEFDLDGLSEPKNLDVLRKVFTDPDALKPGQSTQALTEQAAEHFGQLADGLRQRGIDAHAAGHFLMKLIFCLFAEDIELLPAGLFSRILVAAKKDATKLTPTLKTLFAAMSNGGMFGAEDILYFNGGLFADDQVFDLKPKEIEVLVGVSAFDWSSIDPSIFGTLFERILDPTKRSQIGAHYTSREDIETLLNPVMLSPLKKEWDAVREKCDALYEEVVAAARGKAAKKTTKKKSPRALFDRALLDFDERLAHVTVLDPACGSGNFLYVALQMLLGLEKEVIGYAAKRGLSMLPKVLPTQLAGLEINPHAAELAQVAIWIGYLQWMRDNGFSPPSNPVLEPIESIRCQDAILDLTNPAAPLEPEWPAAEFIVGNPPFLGGKRILSELGDEYTSALRSIWSDRLPNFSDLCCFWFEKAREQIAKARTKRAGLLATQGIRGGANREVLKRIKETGGIFFGVSDQNWILDGATVHVSMVGFDSGAENIRTLDGKIVSSIHSNLSSTADITQAIPLPANANLGFIGCQKSGSFDLPVTKALEFARKSSITGLPCSDVLRVYWTALDVVQRDQETWLIDFIREDEKNAALYEAPFEHLRAIVPADRTAKHFQGYPFWQLWRPRPEMYAKVGKLSRFLVTPHVSKHRIFAWAAPCVCPSNLLIAVATDADFDFGVLQSKAHEVWALALGTQLREKESGFRYTVSTCFETFPFPQPTDAHRDAIAAAAKELDTLRNNWLNPPELVRTEVLEFPGTVGGPWDRYIDPATVKEIDPGGSTGAKSEVGTVKYPRLVAKDDECAKELKKRTLTNLYNQRPTWLDHAHRRLDAAVFAAYGWEPTLSDDELLAKLLALNLASA